MYSPPPKLRAEVRRHLFGTLVYPTVVDNLYTIKATIKRSFGICDLTLPMR
jgi:hypothetical protein